MANLYIVVFIIFEYYLHLQWLKAKQLMTFMDNLYNTGLWQTMLFEILLSLVMNYPSLYGSTYVETADDLSAGK